MNHIHLCINNKLQSYTAAKCFIPWSEATKFSRQECINALQALEVDITNLDTDIANHQPKYNRYIKQEEYTRLAEILTSYEHFVAQDYIDGTEILPTSQGYKKTTYPKDLITIVKKMYT